MDSEWFHDDIIELIHNYESSELLWLPSCAEYRDKEKKRAKEVEIAAKLQKTVQEVQKKWSNLRTQFLKEYSSLKKKLPSGSASSALDPNKVKWRFFRDLFFLAATVANKASRRCNLQITGEASQSVSGEASQEDAEEVLSDTEQQSHAQQESAQPANVSTPQQKPSTSRQKRKKKDDDEAIAAIGHYFEAKSAKTSTAAAPASASEDDFAFGTVISLELKKIQSPWIKRAVKKQLMDVVFNGQELEEQQQVLQVVVSAETAAQPPSATSAASEGEAQLLLQMQQSLQDKPAQLQDEQRPSTSAIPASEAQLLLQMQEQE